MATRRTKDEPHEVTTAKILGVIEELRSKLDELEMLVIGAGQTKTPGTKELTSSDKPLTTTQAADILQIHPTNLSRLAQLNLIPHERIKGPGGGRGGQYRFSVVELLEVKPQIRELVSKARKMLSVAPDEYASLGEAVEITGLTVRVIERMVETGRVASIPEGDAQHGSEAMRVRLKDLVDLIKEEESKQVAKSVAVTSD